MGYFSIFCRLMRTKTQLSQSSTVRQLQTRQAGASTVTVNTPPVTNWSKSIKNLADGKPRCAVYDHYNSTFISLEFSTSESHVLLTIMSINSLFRIPKLKKKDLIQTFIFTEYVFQKHHRKFFR